MTKGPSQALWDGSEGHSQAAQGKTLSAEREFENTALSAISSGTDEKQNGRQKIPIRDLCAPSGGRGAPKL
jgi:hypothetical protein